MDIEKQIKKRKYTGPVKGSDEAKQRMARVRAAQWAKNGLILSNETPNEPVATQSNGGAQGAGVQGGRA